MRWFVPPLRWSSRIMLSGGEADRRREKHHKAQALAAKPRQVDALILQEQSVAGAFRSIGVTDAIKNRRSRLFSEGTPDATVIPVDLYQTIRLIQINLQHESFFVEFVSDIFKLILPQLCPTEINRAISAHLRGAMSFSLLEPSAVSEAAAIRISPALIEYDDRQYLRIGKGEE